MAEAVYLLCAATSIVCGVLLLRGYQMTKTQLLFWASLCFLGLAINNVILFIDLIILPGVDLFWWRTLPAIGGMAVLLYGLISESR